MPFKNNKSNLQAAGTRLPNQGGKVRRQTMALIMAIIPFIGFLIFSIAPIILSVIALFFDVDLNNLTDMKWNNFEGFRIVFKEGYAQEIFGVPVEDYFWKSLGITAWVASTQIVTLVIALIMSVLLARKLPGSKLFQILFFIPYICSTVAVTYMWGQIFRTDSGGALNSLLGQTINWQDENHVTWTIIVAIMWQAPGYGIVMYKAALANVNKSLYEAADIDGANGWQKFWNVTFPSIAPTTYYLLICGVVGGWLTFDIAKLMAVSNVSPVGGRNQMGLTLLWLVYYLVENSTGFGLMNSQTMTKASTLSAACVITWFLFAIVAGINAFLFRKREKSMR